MQNLTPIAIAAFVLELAPAVAFACASDRITRALSRWPLALRVTLPVVFVVPYLIVSISAHIFQWKWFALYALLPVAIAWLLVRAASADPGQRGDWRDAFSF
ncbi:MAG: hypothetical protein WAL56_22955 [Candidatus Sulfotelmatobacter sp.]